MIIDIACEALKSKRVLELRYSGYFRCVEVHTIGFSSKDQPVMRVWQTGGGSVHGETTGWKLLRLDEAEGASISEIPSAAPRSGYKRGDRAMKRIICEI